MNLSSKALWLALYRILSLDQVGVGCSMTLRTAMQAWSETGLRQADLARCLDSLAGAGFVALESTWQGPVLRVLDEQFGLIRPGHADRELVDKLDQLRQTRRRRHTHLSGLACIPDDRRASDPARQAQAQAQAA